MKNNDEMLKIVSNETKTSIDQIPIVTPSVYNYIFNELVKKYDINIEDEEEFSKSLVEEICINLTQLQERASKNAKELSETATKAIDAMKEKDESALSEIIKETEHLRMELEKLKEAVYRDELTHVYNRRWLNDNLLEDDSDIFVDEGKLAIVDLNYFKDVNDTYGHIIGDKVLIFIANNLKKTKCDVVRYGGDEFIIIFPKEMKLDDAKKIVGDIRDTIVSKKLKVNESSFHVSFSFGITEFSKGDSLAATIEKADKNMYEDKIAIKKRIKGI